MAEEEELSDSEAVDKVRETGSSGMIIGETLCLFAHIACSLFLLSLVWRSQPQINDAGEGRCQGWSNMQYTRGSNTGPFAGSGG